MAKRNRNEVKIKLFGGLRDKIDGKRDDKVKMPEGSTIRDLFEEIGLPEEKAKLMMVNGNDEKLDYVLKDGDKLSVFPLVMGG